MLVNQEPFKVEFIEGSSTVSDIHELFRLIYVKHVNEKGKPKTLVGFIDYFNKQTNLNAIVKDESTVEFKVLNVTFNKKIWNHDSFSNRDSLVLHPKLNPKIKINHILIDDVESANHYVKYYDSLNETVISTIIDIKALILEEVWLKTHMLINDTCKMTFLSAILDFDISDYTSPDGEFRLGPFLNEQFLITKRSDLNENEIEVEITEELTKRFFDRLKDRDDFWLRLNLSRTTENELVYSKALEYGLGIELYLPKTTFPFPLREISSGDFSDVLKLVTTFKVIKIEDDDYSQ